MAQQHHQFRVVLPACVLVGLGLGYTICRLHGPAVIKGENTHAGETRSSTPAQPGSSPPTSEPPKLSPRKTRAQTDAEPWKPTAVNPLTPANKSTAAHSTSPRKMSRKDRCLSSAELAKDAKTDLARRQRARREACLYPVGPIEEVGLGLSAQTLKAGQAEADASSPVQYQELEEQFHSLQKMKLPLRAGADEDGNPFWDSPAETEECIRLFQEKRAKTYADSAQYLDNMKRIIEKNTDELTPKLRKRAVRCIDERRAALRLEMIKTELMDVIVQDGLLPELDTSDPDTRNAFLESQFESRKFVDGFEDLLHLFLDLDYPLDAATFPSFSLQDIQHKFKALNRISHEYYRTRELVIRDEDDSEDEIHQPRHWCPITKIYHDIDNSKIGHIVPYYLSGRLAAHLFNLPSELGEREVIWNAKNTLPMSHVIERLFDKHMVTLVPESSTEFRFIVLHAEAGKTRIAARGPGPDFRKVEMTVGELHNTTLEWKNEHRPSHRFLFWHFLFSLKRRRVGGVLGWEYDNETIKLDVKGREVDFREVWASPKGFLSKSLLGVLAQRDGFTNLPAEFYSRLDRFGMEEEDRQEELLEGEEALLVMVSEFAVEQRVADRKAVDADYEDF